MSSEPLVSVVTPVYNTGEFLAECIESVLQQSYQNWEYVIVNNCSTDNSLEIAESYSAADPRIRVVNTDRLLPLALNFNFALRQIPPQSRYCKMVLADDGLFPTCLQDMVALAETDDAIAIVGAYGLAGRGIESAGLLCAGPTRFTAVLSGREACRLFFLDSMYLFGTPTDRKSTRLNSSHSRASRMPSSA